MVTLGDNTSKSTLNKLMHQHSVETVLFMTFFRPANVFVAPFMLTHAVFIRCLWSVLDIFFVFSSFSYRFALRKLPVDFAPIAYRLNKLSLGITVMASCLPDKNGTGEKLSSVNKWHVKSKE